MYEDEIGPAPPGGPESIDSVICHSYDFTVKLGYCGTQKPFPMHIIVDN